MPANQEDGAQGAVPAARVRAPLPRSWFAQGGHTRLCLLALIGLFILALSFQYVSTQASLFLCWVAVGLAACEGLLLVAQMTRLTRAVWSAADSPALIIPFIFPRLEYRTTCRNRRLNLAGCLLDHCMALAFLAGYVYLIANAGSPLLAPALAVLVFAAGVFALVATACLSAHLLQMTGLIELDGFIITQARKQEAPVSGSAMRALISLGRAAGYLWSLSLTVLVFFWALQGMLFDLVYLDTDYSNWIAGGCVAAGMFLLVLRFMVLAFCFARLSLRTVLLYYLSGGILATLITLLPGGWKAAPICALAVLVIRFLLSIHEQDPEGIAHIPDFIRQEAGRKRRLAVKTPQNADRG